MELSEIKNILNNLSDDVFSYAGNISSGATISISSGATLIGGINIGADVDINSLTQEKLPKLPEKSDDEKTLDDIRKQEDYVEQKFYNDGYVDYILESSVLLGKTAKMTFLYNENHGGKGTLLEIL